MCWAAKLIVMAVAILVVVPLSMRLSDYVYEINQVEAVEEIKEVETEEEPEEDLPWYKRIWNNVTEKVKSTAEAALEAGKKALNDFVNAVSVFLIAYCAIPVLVVVVFLWLMKFLFGLKVNIDKLPTRRRSNALKEQLPAEVEE